MPRQEENGQRIPIVRESRLQIESVHLGHLQICQHTAGRIRITLCKKFMR